MKTSGARHQLKQEANGHAEKADTWNNTNEPCGDIASLEATRGNSSQAKIKDL